MHPDFDELAISFGRVLYKIRKVLLSKSSLLPEIKEYIGFQYIDHKAMLEKFNAEQVIDVIRDKCTLAEFPLLKAIIEDCEITEAKAVLDSYVKQLDVFYKKASISSMLNRSLQVTMTPRPLPSEKIVFSLSWNPENYTLHDVKCLLEKFLSKEYKDWVNVIVIKPDNSIVVVCTFPPHLLCVLVTKTQENIEVIKMETIKLTIGHFTVWNKYERDQVQLHVDCISNNCTIGSDGVRERSLCIESRT